MNPKAGFPASSSKGFEKSFAVCVLLRRSFQVVIKGSLFCTCELQQLEIQLGVTWIAPRNPFTSFTFVRVGHPEGSQFTYDVIILLLGDQDQRDLEVFSPRLLLDTVVKRICSSLDNFSVLGVECSILNNFFLCQVFKFQRIYAY